MQTNLPEIQEKLRTRDVHGYRLAFPFATLCQPRGETFGKAFRSEAETGFDLTIGDRKRVVKVGGVGKIAHAELIEPIDGASASLTANHNLNIEFLCVHGVERRTLSSLPHIRMKNAKLRVKKREGA